MERFKKEEQMIRIRDQESTVIASAKKNYCLTKNHNKNEYENNLCIRT